MQFADIHIGHLSYIFTINLEIQCLLFQAGSMAMWTECLLRKTLPPVKGVIALIILVLNLGDNSRECHHI